MILLNNKKRKISPFWVVLQTMPLGLLYQIICFGITSVALTLFAVRVRTLLAIYKKGAADPTRRNDKGTRLRMALREIFGHTKMFNFTVVGFAHWFVMIGFFALFGTLITAYGQLIHPRFALPIIGHFWVYEYFTCLLYTSPSPRD